MTKSKAKPEPTKFRILSCDGGGMRGAISSQILKEVEDAIKEEYDNQNMKLNEYFDLIVGTSTGSIIAAYLACGGTADALINKLYKKDGKNIFLASVRKLRKAKLNFVKSSKLSKVKVPSPALLNLQTIGDSVLKSFQRKKYPIGVQGDKYSPDFWGNLLLGIPLYPHKSGSKGLAKVLEKKLQDERGKSMTMRDIKNLNRADLLIPAYDIYSRNTTWFASDDDQEWYYDNVKLWEICTASSSAPLLFPPYKIPYFPNKKHGQNLPHIDGAVSLADPEVAGIAFTLSKTMKEGKDNPKIDEIALLSIGTGRSIRPYKYKEMKKWKISDFFQNILNIFLYPSTENSGYISHRVFLKIQNKQGQRKRLRLDFELNEELEGKQKSGFIRPRLSKKYSYNKYIWEEWKSKPENHQKIDKLYDELKIQKKAKDIEREEKDIDKKIAELEDSRKFRKKLFKLRNKVAKVSEEVDNPKPEICDKLIEAAKCYLEHGKVDNQEPVKSAIREFIKSHKNSDEA